MSNLISIERKKEPNQQLIDILRDLLTKAESGDINGVAFTVSMVNGSTGRTWFCGDGCNPITQIGMLDIVKMQILQAHYEASGK